MKKERILYVFLAVILLAYLLVIYSSPKPTDWTVTHSRYDKNPYGGFILADLLPGMFDSVSYTRQTVYEWGNATPNLLVLAEELNLTDVDYEAMETSIREGAFVMLSAQSLFMDSSGFTMKPFASMPGGKRQASIHGQVYEMSPKILHSVFDEVDSAWQVEASLTLEGQEPILISKRIGEGRLYVSSTPLAFTNYALIESYGYAEQLLNRLPSSALSVTLFYQLGKGGSRSELRYVVSQPALRWATYLVIGLGVVLLVVDSRRKQRKVPVIKPLANTTQTYVKTLGALFYREKNYYKASDRIIAHFLQHLSQKYFRKPVFDEDYYSYLSQVLPAEKVDVVRLFDYIQELRTAQSASQESLEHLYRLIKKLKPTHQ